METLNIDPNKCYILEIENPVFDKTETITVPNLTLEMAKEYHDRMEPDAEYKFFRVWPDGSTTEVDFDKSNFKK